MIHVDQSHTKLNQPVPANSKKIVSIYDSAYIHEIKNILSSPVHLAHTPSPVTASPIFTYGTASDPQSPPDDSSAEIVTLKGNTTLHNNPPNPATKVPADPDSDPNLSYSSPSDSSDLSYDEYYKRKKRSKNNKKKLRSKIRFNKTIKKCAKLTSKILTAACKSNLIQFNWIRIH